MQTRMSDLELMMIKAKQELGEYINIANEYELKNINLKNQLDLALQQKALLEKKGKK